MSGNVGLMLRKIFFAVPCGLVALKYGLLGFMTARPLNGNFMEYPHVFFGRNGFFETDFMETRECLQVFQPFGIKQGQPKTGFAMPPALIMGKPLEYSIVFSRNYAECTDWPFGVFSEFYTHFAACAAYHTMDNPVLQGRCADIVSSFCEYGLGFRMRMDGKPMLVWDFNSLKTALETVYAFLVSSAVQPLCMCKHCGKVFFATHGRTEFCSGRCRNQFNVYKSRGKGKTESFSMCRIILYPHLCHYESKPLLKCFTTGTRHCIS